MKIILLVFINISFLFSIEIFDVTDKTAKINISNLNVGHSGIIIKEIDNNSIIITQAIVSKSNNENSTLEFIKKEILPQNAIPTSNIRPNNGDKFILNHLYKTSLLIVPNTDAKNKLLQLYPNQNFLNEDFFAAHLKVIDTPAPTKEVISKFTQSQQIGSIFVVIKDKLYILDSITFKIVTTVPLSYKDTSTNIPFLTKIKDIKESLWSFGNNSIKDYNKYYSKLLEIQ
jgi:hypothetical protein